MHTLYLTADHPGIGGKIKVKNIDFGVEEIPLYLPSGQGQHTFITFEKNGLSTFQAVQLIARALRVNAREIGYAGLKDAHAVTVQTISVADVPTTTAERLNLDGIRILSVSRHTNKLKVGHLRGNRFTIRVRDVPPDAQIVAQTILDILANRGVPNYFGEQRFGVRGDTHLLGRALVLGSDEEFVRRFVGMPHPDETPLMQQARQWYEESNLAAALAAWPGSMQNERRVVQTLLNRPGEYERAVRSVPPKLRDLFVSAYQSALFNRLLARRLPTVDRLSMGDLAWIHSKGAVFLVREPEVEQPRADQLEISPSGPLYGYKMTATEGIPGDMERQILAEEGLVLDDWRRPRFKGARRPLRFPVQESRVWYDEGVMLSFALPPGCYATVVLAEVMKSG